MRKYYLIFTLLLCKNIFSQNPEIKTDLPTIIPPSPTVAALMKFEEVPVSNYTGIPDISIPLFSSPTHSKDINLDISLKYHPAGVAANEKASDVGLGWSLFAGGTISRTVRGLPDELFSMYTNQEKIGLYHHNTMPVGYENNYYAVLQLIKDYLANNVSLEWNARMQIDEVLWNSLIMGMSDTEHDLWQFNFMGKSGRFYIEKNDNNQLEVKPLDNYQLKIINQYGNSENQYLPTSFIIFDEKGYKYSFEVFEDTTLHSFFESLSSTTYETNTNFNHSYSYRSSFHLNKIEDNQGNTIIDFIYNPISMKEITMDATMTNYNEDYKNNEIANIPSLRDFYLMNPCGMFVKNFNPYPIYNNVMNQKDTYSKKLERININGIARVDFSFVIGRNDDNYLNAQNCYRLNEVTIKNWSEIILKKIKLQQNYFTTKIKRMFLENVEFTTLQNSIVEKYNLYYKNVPGAFLNLENINTDYWGYFNLRPIPDLGGIFKENDANFCTIETLQKMTLPTGGCVIYEFEPNTYSYIGNTELPNFDENPNNWDKEESYAFFDPNPTNHSVPLGNSSNLTNLFTISEEQNVTFKANIETHSQNNQLEYFFSIQKADCSNQCIVGGANFEEGDNEKTFSIHLLPGTYKASFWSPVQGSHLDLIKGSIVAFYKIKNLNNLKFLYGGGNRISKIGYFKDRNVNQDCFQNFSPIIPDKEKHYEYLFENNLSTGSLVYNVPNFSYVKIKKECPNCIGAPTPATPTEQVSISWKDDIHYYWWYNITTTFNNLNPVKTQGSDVGYKKVKVYETNNGYSYFEYSSPIDFPEQIGILNLAPPFLPTENYEYKRGLLKRETHFDPQDRPLLMSSYEYDFDNYLITTGFKSYYDNFDFINLRQNKTFPQYKWYIEHCDQHPLFNGSDFHYQLNDGDHCFCYYGRPDDFINFSLIKEAYGWAKLISKTTKNYFYDSNNNQNIVETNETFDYNPLNKKISESTVSNSLGDILKTKYFYHTGNSTFSQNRISEIERIEKYRGTELLSTSKINYANNWNGNVSYLPQSISTSKGSNTLENRMTYNKYDEYGNPLEVQQENGTIVSYIWGYNQTQPIAKLENVSYSSILAATITDLQTKSDSDIDASSELLLRNALDALRTTFPTAMITTYTYNPLIGVSTITDSKGDRQTFMYDSFGRLQYVKDKNGNILSENEYHYRP